MSNTKSWIGVFSVFIGDLSWKIWLYNKLLPSPGLVLQFSFWPDLDVLSISFVRIKPSKQLRVVIYYLLHMRKNI